MTADVEALADILMSRELHEARVYGRDYARAEAEAVLASDWLAAHVARLLSEERERVAAAIDAAIGSAKPTDWTVAEWQAYLSGRDDQRQMDAAIARAEATS